MKKAPKKGTVVRKSVFRALITFTSLSILLFILGVATIYAGIQSGEINEKIINPIKNSYTDFIKSLEQTDSVQEPLALPSPSPTITPTPWTQQKSETIYYYQDPQPTYAYPTAIPGRPGSKEWDEEFWRKWDEMGKKNAEMQKKVEDSQKKFCEENAELCNR